MITQAQKDKAYAALRTAGFEPGLARELLAGPKGLRDEFAKAALTGMASNPESGCNSGSDLAHWSYRVADAMMKQRSGS